MLDAGHGHPSDATGGSSYCSSSIGKLLQVFDENNATQRERVGRNHGQKNHFTLALPKGQRHPVACQKWRWFVKDSDVQGKGLD